MHVRSYVIYDMESGNVVQIHVEPADLATAPDELVRMADPAGKHRLKVLEDPPAQLLGRAARVVNGKLTPADDETPAASAAILSEFDEPPVSREYRAHR